MSSKPFLVPRGSGQAVLVEKCSRFIGMIFPVSDEDGARSALAEARAAYKDASHYVYAYILRNHGVLRYSDDGEPRGTGGPPVLEVLRREDVFDVCCVVARYFGGTLLGVPGLIRAYAASAKAALDAAGTALMRAWTSVTLSCPYALWRQVKLEIVAVGGIEESVDFGVDVTVDLALPTSVLTGFLERMADVTAGQALVLAGVEGYRAI